MLALPGHRLVDAHSHVCAVGDEKVSEGEGRRAKASDGVGEGGRRRATVEEGGREWEKAGEGGRR